MKRSAALLVFAVLITLSSLAQGGPKRGDLVRADYGSGNQWVDVTQRVRSLIQGETLKFRVDNDTLGVDPRHGQAKLLRLQFRDRKGRTREQTFQENQYVSLRVNGLSQADRQGNSIWGRSTNPSDGACFYRGGSDSERFCLDTGQSLSSMPSGFNDQISSIQLFGNASVTVFKDSGFSGERQTFASSVADLRHGTGSDWSDRISSVRVDRNDSSSWNNGYANRGDLRIVRAVYGSGDRSSDVTDRLNSQVRGNVLNLRVTNDAMGGDPSPNQRKSLTVRYTFNGGSAESVTNEGDLLTLPADRMYNAPTSYNDDSSRYDGGSRYNGRGLRITSARYGAGTRASDVTDRLNSDIRSNQLNLRVTNDTMGGDPSPNVTKSLSVQYVYDGQQRQAVVVNEGDILTLPALDPQTSAQIIRCESNNNSRNYCVADTRGGVRLSRQLSSITCTQGSTWGYENNRIWVDNGCRAEFQLFSLYGTNASSPPYGYDRTIAKGTQLAIRTNEIIESATSGGGQKFSALMYGDVVDTSGVIAIPSGSDVELVIRSTSGSDLVLDIDSLTVAGQRYAVSTADLEQKGGQGIGANRRTVEMVGGGAAVGAIIGAVLGGGKGAAIGAGVGAAGGAGVEVLTKGKQVKVPAETILNFKLDTDLRLQAARR